MSWQEIRKRRGGGPASNRVTARLDSEGRLQICIGALVIDGLGWAAQERVTVEVGDGEHAGLVRVAAAAFGAGYKLSRCGGSARSKYQIRSKRVTVCGWKGLTDAARQLTAIEYHVVDGAIVMTLPKRWLMARSLTASEAA